MVDRYLWSQLLQSVQCANVAATNYLTGDKQVPSAPAKLYHVARTGRLSHMILMSILVSRIALTFTIHVAGNEQILFHHYHGNYRNFFTATTVLP